MRKTIKKGFTLVELLVVIAIIAILSIVGIVGYVSFTNRARISNDTTIVTELNRVLQAEHVDGKPETMQGIVDEIYDAGFVLSKLSPTASKHHIVYDSAKDRFFLLNDKYKVVGGDLDGNDLTGDAWDHWKVIHSYSETSDEHFSYYLGEMKDSEPAEGVLVHNGIDVGENKVNTIKYENKTTTVKSVIIRTDGSSLTVDAQNDTVRHYGDGTVLNIEAVDTQNCYREFGTFENAQIKTGRIVLEKEDSRIENLLLIAKENKSGFEDIVVETKAGASLPAFDRTEVEIAEKGTLVLNVVTPTSDEFIYLTKAGVIEQVVVTTEAVDTNTVDVTTVESAKAASETSTQTYTAADQIANVGTKNANGDYVDANNEVIIYSNGTVAEGKDPANIATEAKADAEAVAESTSKFAGGVGTEKSPYLITNQNQFANIYVVTGKYYRIANDFELDLYPGSGDTFQYENSDRPFNGVLDGANRNVIINNHGNGGWGYLIEPNEEAIIKNIRFNHDENAMFLVESSSYDLTFDHVVMCNKDGKVTKVGGNSMSMYLRYSYALTKYDGCSLEGQFNFTGDYAGLFCGYSFFGNVIMKDCVNKAIIYGKSVGFLCGNNVNAGSAAEMEANWYNNVDSQTGQSFIDKFAGNWRLVSSENDINAAPVEPDRHRMNIYVNNCSNEGTIAATVYTDFITLPNQEAIDRLNQVGDHISKNNQYHDAKRVVAINAELTAGQFKRGNMFVSSSDVTLHVVNGVVVCADVDEEAVSYSIAARGYAQSKVNGGGMWVTITNTNASLTSGVDYYSYMCDSKLYEERTGISVSYDSSSPKTDGGLRYKVVDYKNTKMIVVSYADVCAVFGSDSTIWFNDVNYLHYDLTVYADNSVIIGSNTYRANLIPQN